MDVHLIRRLFASLDAFGEPFTLALPSRLLLSPTDGYILRRDQFEALAAAAGDVGDSEADSVSTEGVDLNAPPPVLETVRFNLGSYEEYRRHRNEGHMLLENAIIPDSGKWAVLFSQEFHAVVGGQPTFIRAFVEAYPHAGVDLARFVAEWKAAETRIGSDISWLPRLLKHLNVSSPPE
jgi:hypothetical protein